jgi:hypothetical protein
MDVIVSLVPGPTEVWNLTDRLGRRIGQIERRAENEFVIAAADSRPDAPLARIEAVQPSLDAAMDLIGRCLRGLCQHADHESR